MFQKFASFLGFVLFALLAPCLAQAQDNASPSLEEKFGGWYISGDINLGSGPIGDTSSEPGYYHDDFIRFHSNNYRSFESYVSDDTQMAAGFLQFQAGYLFGSKVFMGPELSLSVGWPNIVSGDVRFRLAAPISGAHAIDAAIGLGYRLANMLADASGDVSATEHLYIPMQVGYNYTYDNGFMIGVSFQINLVFVDEERYHRTSDDEYWWDNGGYDVEDKVMPFVADWGIGLRLGYRFGHHE